MVEDIIDPADTQPVLCRWVRTAYHTMARVRSDRRAGRSGPDRPRPHRSLDPEERQVGLAVERGLEAADAVGTR